ncbi:cytochrome c oxidase assembly protein [Subtercola frigoramans]|uniref:Copper resistance protein D n=1 Tax=Subtercola frigoramans TaxID=120298 RepID=A0ABS2L1S5_9MICO|nr:cytochrome c oxidase assembly protein [Subtercola frigoramans]MBM7470416.1 putative copper resistance protein D [Subtercola frigoramans]
MPKVVRIAGPAVLVVVAFVVLVLGLEYGGGATAQLLEDPGPLVRFGLPMATLLVNLSASLTIGALLLAVFALRSSKPEFTRAMDVAAAGAALLTVSAALTGFLSFLNVTSASASIDSKFGQILGQFLISVPLGQAWLETTLIAAAVTVLCFAVRNLTALVFVGLLAVVALVPMAQQGHAAGADGHDAAITALFLHLVFSAVWLGGLLTLALLSKQLDNARLVDVVSRYSSVALVCFVVVAASGYVSAELRVGSLDRLLTPYGILVVVKVVALVVLGLIGALYRRLLIRRLSASQGRAAFWQIVIAELVFMGVASGVAVALARTATPIPETVPTTLTPAQILTGEPLPPELSAGTALGQWNFDLLWVLVCAFGIFFYLAGVWRLRRRGDSWPVHRTVFWVLGMLLLLFVTNGFMNVYEKYLFSVHMLGHMILAMMIPIFLVSAGPVTLALRAIHKRTDETRGAREWILLAVHSRFGTFVSNPIVAAILFATSLLTFYYTPLFRWATVDHIGHEWMIVHFLIVGYLFAQALIGVDPVPYRLPYPFRLLLLLATMAFHAFFGLTLMTGSGLLLADWYGSMGRTWGASAIVDQQTGGGIAWSIGEIPTIILAIVVAIQWGRSDTKETKRLDRTADRTNDAELNDYNAMLERLGRSR